MADFNISSNRAVWFDIPVVDLRRATDFYADLLGVTVDMHDMEGIQFSVIEHSDGNGGCLVPNADEVSSSQGILLYLNVHGRIREAAQKTKDNGGSVVQDVHSIGPHGFRAIILDSEGNRVALHSEVDA